MTISPEFQLLCALLPEHFRGAMPLPGGWGGVDPEAFRAFVAGLPVAPQAFHAWERTPALWDATPFDTRARIVAWQELFRHRQRERFAAWRELLAAFAAAGVPVIALKGFVLSRFLYGDPFRRRSADVDLLVAPGDRDRADARLRSDGFAPIKALGPAASAEVEYLRPAGGGRPALMVDLHWDVVPRWHFLWQPLAGVWERAVTWDETAKRRNGETATGKEFTTEAQSEPGSEHRTSNIEHRTSNAIRKPESTHETHEKHERDFNPQSAIRNPQSDNNHEPHEPHEMDSGPKSEVRCPMSAPPEIAHGTHGTHELGSNPQSAIRNPQSDHEIHEIHELDTGPKSEVRCPMSANPQSAIRNPQFLPDAVSSPHSTLVLSPADTAWFAVANNVSDYGLHNLRGCVEALELLARLEGAEAEAFHERAGCARAGRTLAALEAFRRRFFPGSRDDTVARFGPAHRLLFAGRFGDESLYNPSPQRHEGHNEHKEGTWDLGAGTEPESEHRTSNVEHRTSNSIRKPESTHETHENHEMGTGPKSEVRSPMSAPPQSAIRNPQLPHRAPLRHRAALRLALAGPTPRFLRFCAGKVLEFLALHRQSRRTARPSRGRHCVRRGPVPGDPRDAGGCLRRPAGLS